MSCSNYDWKAYALGELDADGRREAEAHAAACSLCREELASTRLTLDALSTLREEEIPRRIAFVSDKVFEPRWWQVFLQPSFAGAWPSLRRFWCMVSSMSTPEFRMPRSRPRSTPR